MDEHPSTAPLYQIQGCNFAYHSDGCTNLFKHSFSIYCLQIKVTHGEKSNLYAPPQVDRTCTREHHIFAQDYLHNVHFTCCPYPLALQGQVHVSGRTAAWQQNQNETNKTNTHALWQQQESHAGAWTKLYSTAIQHQENHNIHISMSKFCRHHRHFCSRHTTDMDSQL